MSFKSNDQANEQKGKQNGTTKTTEEYRESIKKSLDDTKDNIRRSIDESRHNIPRYTAIVNEYQEQTLQAARDIAESYVEAQKEIINTLEYTWIPFSPSNITEMYAAMVSGFADNIITGARMANNMLFSNMDSFKKTMQQTKENSKEISRLSVNTARNIQQVTRKYVEPR